MARSRTRAGEGMPHVNFGAREIRCKLVYWGPGLSGKTTNLHVIHKKAPPERRGEMVAIATEGDRTLFFDYLPLDLGEVGGMRVRFQLYTVPGQEYYRATRRLVLQGADGVVFVADSRAEKRQDNLSALEDLEATLVEHGLDRQRVPVVFQWNKRDMPGALPVDELDRALNHRGAPSFEAVASKGEGVFPTLRCAAGLVLEELRRQFGFEPDEGRRARSGEASRAAAPAPTPAPPPAPAPPAPAPAPAPLASAPAPARTHAPRARRAPGRPGVPAPVVVAAPRREPRGSEPRPRRAGRAALTRALLLLLLLLLLGAGAGFVLLGRSGGLPAPLQAVWARHVGPLVGR